MTIRRSVFLGNQAGREGGALYNQQGSTLTVENSVFVGNALRSAGKGGAVSITGSTAATITNSTIAHNEVAGIGSGVSVGGSATLLAQNTVLHGNLNRSQASGSPPQVEIEPDSNALVAVEYSIIEGGFPGPGNLDKEPGFVQTPTPGDGTWVTIEDNDLGNVRLLATSPGIDAGNNLAEVEGTGDELVIAADLEFDADRQRRLFDAPDVPDTGVGGPPVIDIGAYEFVIVDEIFEDGFE